MSATYRQEALIQDLVKARHSSKLSQRDVASRIGRLHTYVAKLENMERRLDVADLIDYCSAVGIDPCAAIQRFLPVVEQARTERLQQT